MSPHKLDELSINYTPTSIVTSKHVDKEYDGVKSIIHPEEMMKSWDSNNKAFKLSANVALVFAIILAVVVIYNHQLLTFLEMKHDIIILKVLGFKDIVLSRLLLSQGLFFIFLGIVLATPLSYYIIEIMWNFSAEKYYQVAYISPMNFLLTCAILFSVVVVVNLLFAYKIRRTDLVEATKILE